MDRRNFVKRSMIFGLSSFIPISALQTMANSMFDAPVSNEMMDKNDIIPAPENPEEWLVWREALHNWKKKKQAQLNYDGSSYRSIPFEWVTSDFACCFVMMYDSEFYDPVKGEYTIKYLISEGKKRYGGYDSVVLWHAYPRIGLDERNQFDFYRDMPQGLAGLKKVSRQFHQQNIKVFIDYNPWDTGTRREQQSDIDGLIEIIRSIEADGIFLDTMKDAPDFREKLDVIKPGLVMEGEIALPLEHIQSHHLSWAQGFKDSKVPGVYRNKWFERRHMQHAIHRWGNDKSIQLQTAWMNGSGIMIWENIFGQWIGWNERDKSIYRTMYAIQHRYHELFSGDGWTPLSQESPVLGVYVSLWEGEGTRLWTLVNRNEFPVEGVLMTTKSNENSHYFDLINGVEINVENGNAVISLRGSMCRRGIACFVALEKNRVNLDFKRFINKQKWLAKMSSTDISIPIKPVQRVEVRNTIKRLAPLNGMVVVPGASLKLNFVYTLNEIGSYGTIQNHLSISAKNKQFQPYQFEKDLVINNIAIDETPVTNTMFKEFIIQSGYKPQFKVNYLKHWLNGQVPEGKEDHPVVYVDLNDARAYASWAGKRLPNEFEWQYAAQGSNALAFPWGNEMKPNRCNENTNGQTTPVKSFPKGRSPFGCYDMCSNTWELTESEHSDGRTRFVMLKGGSCFKAKGSHWYTDGGPQVNGFLAKMLLLWPGLDRCSTIGFRCALDLDS